MFYQNWNCQKEWLQGCCGVDCHNTEMESIPGSKTVKLQVFPPWGVCLVLQLKDGQQHWSSLTGICVGVRMSAYEHTVRERYFFPFSFVCARTFVACSWSDLCSVCICLRVYTIVSWGIFLKRHTLWNNSLAWECLCAVVRVIWFSTGSSLCKK